MIKLNTEDSIECLPSQPPPHLKFGILHLVFMWEVEESKRWYFFDPWNFSIPSKDYIEILLYYFLIQCIILLIIGGVVFWIIKSNNETKPIEEKNQVELKHTEEIKTKSEKWR